MMRMMLALVHATLTSATAAGSSGFKPNIVMHLADGGRATRASAAQYMMSLSAALTRSRATATSTCSHPSPRRTAQTLAGRTLAGTAPRDTKR
jgi:hypothetical protein